LGAEAQFVTFIGRLHAIKRLDLLLAAFHQVQAQVPRAHLVIAGPAEPGPLSVDLRLVGGANAAIHWLGEITEEEKWSLLQESAVFAMCSDSESFGVAVVEAMAAGVPVVVTRTCPWQEIETVGCGLWVAQQQNAVATALHRLLTNRLEAEQMGARGREHARARYAWEPIARTMSNYYTQALTVGPRMRLAS
jgi:glycosyltransferase involved in cell wall biosynthesis